MRLAVPLGFLALVAGLLVINLAWWVHYYEPTSDVLNMHSASMDSRHRMDQPIRVGKQVPKQKNSNSRSSGDDKNPKNNRVNAGTGTKTERAKPRTVELQKSKQVKKNSKTELQSELNNLKNSRESNEIEKWDLHIGRSCQNYANDDATVRNLEDSKIACSQNMACVAIECGTGRTSSCTLRSVSNLVPYTNTDCWVPHDTSDPDNSADGKRRIKLHPDYMKMLKQYPFQSVRTQNGQTVNIMLVRSAPNDYAIKQIESLKEHILFIGISSFEDFPKPSVNPFSGKYAPDKYVGLFPGFLHMLRPDDAKKTFPSHVKLLLMSQSDFSLPNHAYRDYNVPRKYDFTYSGSDQDVRHDCVGWSSFAKNWSFVKEALNVMCGEFHLKGVLVATIDKQNVKHCSIPKSCDGLITQTQYIPQNDFLHYVEQSRFLFLPQIHDASPRVSTQALAVDTPLLMNSYISGGWKYLNEKTGEFFHDLSDFREQLAKIVKNADIEGHYEPRKWVTERYGNQHSCKRLYNFIATEFPDWAEAVLPKGTKCLLI
jgi:hypothetical protein